MTKTFTKTQELDLLVALRSAYECAMRGFFCNTDYHSEALKKDMYIEEEKWENKNS